MADDPYSILEVSRHATDAEVERAYERLLNLFDPEHYPGSAEDARRRLAELNEAYVQIRRDSGAVDADSEAASETSDEDEPTERRAAVADALVRIGFISAGAAPGHNPAVDVLAALLPEGADIGICLTCLGVKASAPYQCRERSGGFRAMTIAREGPYATGDHLHAIARTEVVLCSRDELAWTASQYEGRGIDRVTLYSIPFTDILGAAVQDRKRDRVEVWINDGPTVSIRTRPREADALCEFIERAATSA
jgi:DnaJ domain